MRFESLKRISVLLLFAYKLMIGRSKNNREIIRENAFEHKKKKPGSLAIDSEPIRARGIIIVKYPGV